MYRVKIYCKVITPMFMRGADNRTPELRASEFKGMMRWWWRAIKAENDIQNLKSEEEKIFGGVSDQTGRSKFRLFIEETSIRKGKDWKSEYNLHWEYNSKKKTIQGQHAGIGYLFYSVLNNARRDRSEEIYGYITTDSKFCVNLLSFDEKSIEVALSSLWLSIYLGGFGARSRRGAGNIAVEKFEGLNENISFPKFVCNAESKQELKNFLKDGIENIKNIIGSGSGTLKYTNLKGAKIYIFDPQKSWIDALNLLGEAYREFRHQSWIDTLNLLGEAYREFRHQNKTKIHDVAIFGMPIIHKGNNTRVVPYNEKCSSRLSERWASPIIFKVINCGDKYFPVLIRMSIGGIESAGLEEKEGRNWKLKECNKVNEKIIDDKNGLIDFIKEHIKNKLTEKNGSSNQQKEGYNPEELVI